MDGENNGSKPYEQMDDLGVFPYFWKHPYRGHMQPFVWLIEILKKHTRLGVIWCVVLFLGGVE